MMELSLDMKIPNGIPGERWTLAEAVKEMRRLKLTRLLENDTDALSEYVFLFQRAVRNDETPKIGEVWAAWYRAASEALENEYDAVDSAMSPSTYRGRKGAITKLVFERKY